ncbi:MAG: transglutaminase-like domain-containing protein [Thermoanaerobaculia bacterium]
MGRSGFAFLAAALVLASSAEGPLPAATYVVSGVDDATLLVPAGVRVEPYENVGYRLDFEESTARIHVDASPFGSRQGFALAKLAPGRGPASQLARAVAADATSRFEAVSRILAWVAANIRYDLDRGLPQDAENVLTRRSAYCIGVARLTVALLDSLAIPAREVAGYVVGSRPGSEQDGFHRWIEIFYDDRGWVFADPLSSHHLVPATYLRLASSAIESELPGPALLLSREDHLERVDQKSATPAGRVLIRANGEERYSAVLQVLSDAAAPASATLEGAGRRVRLDLVDGRAVFYGVTPATYDLRIWSAGRMATERSVIVDGPRWADVKILVGERPAAGTGGSR